MLFEEVFSINANVFMNEFAHYGCAFGNDLFGEDFYDFYEKGFNQLRKLPKLRGLSDEIALEIHKYVYSNKNRRKLLSAHPL